MEDGQRFRPRPARRPLFGAVGAALFALLPLWTSPALARLKTDVVVLVNGDRLTGEVKSLERGKLKYKLDSAGTIDIEWDDIQSLESTETFEVETEDGSRYFGTLEKGGPGNARVVGQTRTTELALSSIIRLAPIAQSFWARMDGSVSAGANVTHSSQVSTYSFDATCTYRTRRWENTTSLDLNLTQDEIESTTRGELRFLSKRLFKDRWFTYLLASGENNEELGIDLRLLGGYGFGRAVVQTSHSQVNLSGAVDVNEERVSGSEPGGLSAELAGTIEYNVFRYDDPEVDLTVSLVVFPSVTDLGRVRSEFSVALRYDFYRDFFWTLSAFDSYDNQPRDTTAETNDWGVIMSLGLTF